MERLIRELNEPESPQNSSSALATKWKREVVAKNNGKFLVTTQARFKVIITYFYI
jgi:hypothetical protein